MRSRRRRVVAAGRRRLGSPPPGVTLTPRLGSWGATRGRGAGRAAAGRFALVPPSGAAAAEIGAERGSVRFSSDGSYWTRYASAPRSGGKAGGSGTCEAPERANSSYRRARSGSPAAGGEMTKQSVCRGAGWTWRDHGPGGGRGLSPAPVALPGGRRHWGGSGGAADLPALPSAATAARRRLRRSPAWVVLLGWTPGGVFLWFACVPNPGRDGAGAPALLLTRTACAWELFKLWILWSGAL